MELELTHLDSEAIALYLEIPGRKVVELQAYFDLYEGLGVVRTIDIQNSLVCIITTPTMLEKCSAALNALRETIPWRSIPQPKSVAEEDFLGYSSKKKLEKLGKLDDVKNNP